MTLLISACTANIFSDWFNIPNTGVQKNRSLSDAITMYLDAIFGEGDDDADIMGQLIMMLDDDGGSMFDHSLSGFKR